VDYTKSNYNINSLIMKLGPTDRELRALSEEGEEKFKAGDNKSEHDSDKSDKDEDEPMVPEMSEYERIKQKNIIANKELFDQLGLTDALSNLKTGFSEATKGKAKKTKASKEKSALAREKRATRESESNAANLPAHEAAKIVTCKKK
jgi:hypothetical protein